MMPLNEDRHEGVPLNASSQQLEVDLCLEDLRSLKSTHAKFMSPDMMQTALKSHIVQMKHSREFILELARMWQSFITGAGDEIWSLRLLAFVSEELQDDYAIAFLAVSANWKEFEFASQRLRSHAVILEKAVNQKVLPDHSLFKFVHFSCD
jgi:hypothetical protein